MIPGGTSHVLDLAVALARATSDMQIREALHTTWPEITLHRQADGMIPPFLSPDDPALMTAALPSGSAFLSIPDAPAGQREAL
ncbi:hypothetical protein IHN32_12555, partial [Deinococcus sp. 14RED07]|uniref:hypothetical protein n=1 Tax=Deinococcus sp. 14RED07 TaxID=2745874 RepID=UPI001E4F05E3